MVAPRQPVLPPNKLFREFESGRMSRSEFQAAMALHATDLIEEMEEQRRNPLAYFGEFIRNRRVAKKLIRLHGEAAIREVFTILAEVPDFPPASLLWNASHRHVPLHCFIRMNISPLFRVNHLSIEAELVDIDLEYRFSGGEHMTREVFQLVRGWHGNLYVTSRQPAKR